MKIDTFGRVSLLVFLGALLAFTPLAQSATPKAPEPVVIGEKFQIESKALAETRSYVVHTPDDYNKGKGAYAVLVLQDAENSFAYTSAAVHLLSANGHIPAMIVVGINNTDRTRDMTPTKPKVDFGGAPWAVPAGGADKFLAFIADELLPTIDRNYRTRPYRVLIGHSFGGLFAVYALLNRPEVFQGYIITSPSLWWDDQVLVKTAGPFFAAHHDLHADIYMSMANEGDRMLGGAWKLSAELEEARLPHVRWQFKRFPEEEHGTVPFISTYEGLQAIFEGYGISHPLALFEEGGLPAFEHHYAQVSQRLGYTVPVPARAYGDTLWELTNRERFAEAEEVGKKMLEQDPKNTWALFALAQVAEKQKDDARAIVYLTRVLQLYPGSSRARSLLVNYKVDLDKIVPSLQVSAKELAPYVGEYRFKDQLTKVSYQNGNLMAASSFGKCEMHALTQTKFYCVDIELELQFRKDTKGRVVGMAAEWLDHSDEYKKVK
jgi:hypothetical protein